MYKATTRAVMALLILAMLASCQQVFTTSLGTALARESYPDLSNASLEDALSYLADAQGDQDLAQALVAPLYTAASEATPGSAAYDTAATALVEAVGISSGVGAAITVGIMDNPDLLAEIISGGEIDPLIIDDILSSVRISDSEIDALLFISNNPLPGMDTMDSAQAYTAAATLLLAVAFENDISFDNEAAFTTLAGDAKYDAAVRLFEHAHTTLGGADTDLGGMFSSLPF